MAASIYVAELSFYLVRNQEWSTVYAGCKLWRSSKLSIFPSKSCMDPQGKPDLAPRNRLFHSFLTLKLYNSASGCKHLNVPMCSNPSWDNHCDCQLTHMFFEVGLLGTSSQIYLHQDSHKFAVKYLSRPPFWWIESWTPPIFVLSIMS